MASPTTDRRLGLVGNTAYKVPATVVATANIVQSGEQTIDTIAVKAINAAGRPDRVLCIGMTDNTKNGLWDVQTGAWTRSLDANGNYDLSNGTQVQVSQGSNARSVYLLTTLDPITVGTTAQIWVASPAVGFLAALANPANGLGADLVGGVGRVVNTITALRALAKTGAGRAFVLGYYAPGDGGGGQYFYDAADVASADNGGTIIVGADSGRWKLVLTGAVSVKQFGAKGNYTGGAIAGQDDTTAIQAAINWVQANVNSVTYGSYSPSVGTGALYFPQGSYGVSAALQVVVKISILGEGQTEYTYGSRLTQTAANTDLFQISASAGGTSFSIENLVLRNNAAVGTGHLVNMVRAGGGSVNSQRYKNCTFAQPQAMSLFLAGDDIEISSCLFDVSQLSGNCIQLGTAGNGASNVRINNCDFFNITNSVVKLVNISGLTWGAGNVVSQPNGATKTPRIFDAISASPTLATRISISGGMIEGARQLFGGTNVTNVTISGVNAAAGGIGTGESLHMIELIGNCSIQITGNFFRGTYDTKNFYNDTAAAAVIGLIASNSFINDGGPADALACTKFQGRILSNEYSGFVNQQVGEKRTSSTVTPGLIAAGGTFAFAVTVPGATFGDAAGVGTINNAWPAPTGIDVRAFVNAANTVRVEYRNVTAAGITPAAHNIWTEVTR